MKDLRKIREKILQETSTAEFFGFQKKIYVSFNAGKPLEIGDFLKFAKIDRAANKVLGALKLKMRDLNFKDSIIEFIKKYFLKSNDILDVFVPDGVDGSYSKARFDKSELNV